MIPLPAKGRSQKDLFTDRVLGAKIQDERSQETRITLNHKKENCGENMKNPGGSKGQVQQSCTESWGQDERKVKSLEPREKLEKEVGSKYPNWGFGSLVEFFFLKNNKNVSS